jgi:predicted GNAT superfamily acetyltransferase
MSDELTALAESVEADVAQALAACDAEIARLGTVKAQLDGIALLGRVWGVPAHLEIVDSTTVRALDHAGNYVYGALREGRLIGVSIAFFGDGHLHSHITGIDPEVRASGLGAAFKQHQRAWALRRGVTSIEWTFDPLVARNAYFNLQKLGARAVDYLVDFYGPLTDGINRGDPSDRLLIRWDLRRTGAVPPVQVGPGDIAVQAPQAIESLRETDPAAAERWRHRVRDELTGALREGRHIAGITRDGRYVLRTGL